ncbi:helix-turn-helix domain-containing protein [Blautia sp. HCP3S3_H10_1]|uniref:helix-turn-helix domain-containing protein n=1 Tax=unclassified Blautia TaxID=2648079 RepID=UPI003F8FF77C
MQHINVEIDYSPLLTKLEKRNLSGYKLTDFGIPHKTIYNIKQGKIVTIETLAKFAYILDCSISDLVILKCTIQDE